MSEIELLERKLEIIRQIRVEAQRENNPHWPEYARRSYTAWERLELAKRTPNQTGL